MLDFEQLRQEHPDWNWDEAETIAPEDLEAAADFVDSLLAQVRAGKKDQQAQLLLNLLKK